MGLFLHPVRRESRLLRAERMTGKKGGSELSTNSRFIPHVARWSLRQRGRLVITDTAGGVVASYQVDPPGERPGHDMLWRNGWHAFPCAEWEQDPEGEWSRCVFSGLCFNGNGEQSRRKEP